jgi:hypothetical protein
MRRDGCRGQVKDAFLRMSAPRRVMLRCSNAHARVARDQHAMHPRRDADAALTNRRAPAR